MEFEGPTMGTTDSSRFDIESQSQEKIQEIKNLELEKNFNQEV